MRHWLETADRWVTRDRVTGYCLILLAFYSLGIAALVLSLRHGLDPGGNPLGADFIIFYTTSRMTLHGHALAAYTPEAILHAEREVVAASRKLFIWCYPPTFQLLIAPLALLPYRAALAAWTAATAGLYLGAIRLISRDRLALLIALIFPTAVFNLIQGQTGFLTTALLGAGLLLGARRPRLAGLILSLLVYKPHFAVLVPLALLAGRRWRCLLYMGLGMAGLCGGSLLVFGPAAWLGFLHILPLVSHNLATGALPLQKVPTVFASLRLLGVPQPFALGLHLLVAAPVVGWTLFCWWTRRDEALCIAMTMVAALIVSPYAFDYDLVILAVPIGLMLERLRASPSPAGVRASATLAVFAPFALDLLALFSHFQLVPVGLLAFFLLLARLAAPARADRRTFPRAFAGTAPALAG
jgi:alpha-1,2-mannosyltransferase